MVLVGKSAVCTIHSFQIMQIAAVIRLLQQEDYKAEQNFLLLLDVSRLFPRLSSQQQKITTTAMKNINICFFFHSRFTH